MSGFQKACPPARFGPSISVRALPEPSFPMAPSSVNHSLSFVLPLTPRARIQKLVILRGSEHLRRWVPADQSLKALQDTSSDG
jgi:hypothetical protein